MQNISKILKRCRIGIILYSPVIGEVKFMGIGEDEYIIVENKNGLKFFFSPEGKFDMDGVIGDECMLFPSRTQRDWSKFEIPEEKFDPRTFNPFDMVLVMCDDRYWVADIVSHVEEDWVRCIGSGYVNKVIPYNESTKHLIGTSLACPSYYKWWKDILK